MLEWAYGNRFLRGQFVTKVCIIYLNAEIRRLGLKKEMLVKEISGGGDAIAENLVTTTLIDVTEAKQTSTSNGRMGILDLDSDT